MSPKTARFLRYVASATSVLAVLALATAAWMYWRMRQSLPLLDGQAVVAGMTAPVTIARDGQGVPTIRGANRIDVARALGWLHAQDRFFQLDLLRRSSAGELAELFGRRALPHDQAVRRHGFRSRAVQSVAALPAGERAVLDAYTAGVNTGLAALGERPFEYVALFSTPQPWLPEDSILVIQAMALDLQDETGRYERTLMTVRDHLGEDGLAFFAPLVTPADAALDGSVAPIAPLPDPAWINLRPPQPGPDAIHVAGPPPGEEPALNSFPFPPRDPEAVLGSNAFALAGALSASGAGLLASDMHLNHGVPNIWYRASFEYAGRKITGVTLPGVPAMVAGSNGNLSWGFTASYADTGDVVIIEGNDKSEYLVPGAQLIRMEGREEIIRVRGRKDVPVTYQWTRWGPLVGTNDEGKPLAYRWLAHDPAAINLAVLDLEEATDVQQAIRVAHRAGMPALNLLVADRQGTIAWTIAGRLPKRIGYDGRLPVAWTYGDRRWDGFLPPEEIPVRISPGPAAAAPTGPDVARPVTEAERLLAEGRIWSGNQRMLGGEALALVGDGGYPRPHRAGQIRDGLALLQQATPRDLLAIQLDNRALFLTPWQRLLLTTLAPDVTAGGPDRAALRTLAEQWDARAGIDSVGYRLVREFRAAVLRRVFQPIFATCRTYNPTFRWQDLPIEDPLWTLLREQPLHLLSPEYENWNHLLVAAADDTIGAIDAQGDTLSRATWGRYNTAQIHHPFGAMVPLLAGWLSLPPDPLPGDRDMPRVQAPDHGASQRMVVSPGHEADGIFHMPGGQSGHPLSPYYRAGHDAWVQGEPTPFLPGPTVHTLTLTPR